MRRLIILILVFALAGCASSDQVATVRVKEFYATYLKLLCEKRPFPAYTYPEAARYISQKTIDRLTSITKIPEQEIIESDYFTYTQDYDPAWIPRLRVDNAVDSSDGKKADVWLGVEDNKELHLQVFLVKESGVWKIYRVRSITDNYEQRIFNHSGSIP
ncbi:MAG TPA: DUF3828 domain-containing protein [Smithellaceae bacterium]|jgi:hypothetical protein|nr:DUF3828 domain-containing protein [Smithellaceae bacterium]